MSPEQAFALHEDIKDLAQFAENRVWKNHVVKEIERQRDEHRIGMNNKKLTAAERCEHVTAWENATQLLEFLAQLDTRLRSQLREHEKDADFLEGKFNPAKQG